jgi:hypothetical protein
VKQREPRVRLVVRQAGGEAVTVALVEAGGGATGTRIELRVEGPKIVSARDGMVLTVVDHARNRAVVVRRRRRRWHGSR